MKKVSVIMASYLGDYPGRSSNPDKKFIRAVKSFLTQSYENCELIIVADGCDKTEEIYNKFFKKVENIKFIKIDKQPVYGAEIRNAGIDIADGEIISYLDNDDAIGKKHLELIMSEWNDGVDLMYYDDFLVMSPDFKKLHQRIVETRYGSIGTSSITHRNVDYLRWSEGYGHDWIFLMTAIVRGMRFKKLSKPSQYLVAHWGGGEQKGDF
jgi:glycosyltransferase involved in cell wall biosynthesis